MLRPIPRDPVPVEAVIAALAAAVLHAVWNALVKGGGDPLLDLALVWGGSAAVALLCVPFVAVPVAAAWPYLLATLFIHMPYGLLLAAAYRAGSLSHVYTVARGSPPMLIALATAALGETLAPGQYLGIAVISAGILATGIAPHAPARATLLALCVALTIAGYSVLDGLGARASGEPAAYTAWILVGGGTLTVAWSVLRRGMPVFRAVGERALLGVAGGVMSFGAYAIALWAMTVAPIGAVAAVRESSVLFAAAIGAMFLGERFDLFRWVAAGLVMLGLVLVRFGG